MHGDMTAFREQREPLMTDVLREWQAGIKSSSLCPTEASGAS